MIQFEDKRDDIYHILSFCLRYLKRKILLLLKIFLTDKSPTPTPELITELAKQQSTSQDSIALLKNNRSLINKDDEILYQRFVCRIKQLVRNYLPHASLSHQLFVFLKKIQTYSFKPNYHFEDYILYILAENPPSLTQTIHQQMQSLKINDSLKRNSPRRYGQFNPDQALTRISASRQSKKFSFLSNHNSKFDPQLDYQSTKPTEIDNNRPIDIFNKSIKPIMDCLDCDISIIRGVYFNMQKQKDLTHFSTNFASKFTITKTVRQISDQILYQNRFIKDNIIYFDKQYSRYSERLQKQPEFYKNQRKRCQTASGTRRKHNFSILPDPSDNLPKTKLLAQTKNKFETINYQTEQQRQQMFREMQKRKNTVLKMKSISISANKGHLELCAQGRVQSKKVSLTFSNLKKATSKNNSRNVAVNLKKKYDIFMSNFSQTPSKQQVKQPQTHKNLTISTQQHSKVYSTIAHTQKIDWIEQSPINMRKNQQFDIQVSLSPHLAIRNKDTMISDYLEPHQKNMLLRRNIHSRLSEDRNQLSQTMGKSSKVHNDFQNTIKNVMKGGNVNHRNYANHQNRDKRIFETINPELTVKTIRKT